MITHRERAIEATTEQPGSSALTVTANVTLAERMRMRGRFGELTGERLTAIFYNLDRGFLEEWVDLVEFFLATDEELSLAHSSRVKNITCRKWTIKPAVYGDARLAQLAAEFCNEYVRRIYDLHRAFKDIAHAVSPGFSANEMVWKIDGKRDCYMVDRIEHRHGHRFRYGPTWALRLYDRGSRGGPDGFGEVLDPRKWIVHSHSDQAGYPSVYGVTRSLAWKLMFKRYAERFRISGIERFGNPYIWMEIVANAPPEVRDEALAKLLAFSSQQVSVIEQGNVLHVDMPGSMHAGGNPHKLYVDDANGAITKRYLGTSDATSPGENGNYGAVASRTESQTDKIADDDTKAFQHTVQSSLLTWLCRLNWHVFGVADPDDIPIPSLDMVEKKEPAPQQPGRVPYELQPGEESDDESEPEEPETPEDPLEQIDDAPALMTRDPKAAASGEPRPSRRRRSRTTSPSHAILCALAAPEESAT